MDVFTSDLRYAVRCAHRDARGAPWWRSSRSRRASAHDDDVQRRVWGAAAAAAIRGARPARAPLCHAHDADRSPGAAALVAPWHRGDLDRLLSRAARDAELRPRVSRRRGWRDTRASGRRQREAVATRFAADPSLVGGIIRVNDVALTVVGIAPPGFAGLSGQGGPLVSAHDGAAAHVLRLSRHPAAFHQHRRVAATGRQREARGRRALTDDDRPGRTAVAVVNETAARRFWPGQSPIGKRVWFGTTTGPFSDAAHAVGI